MVIPQVKDNPSTGVPVEVMVLETVDIPVMQMKVEFKLEGEKWCEVAKGKVKKIKAVSFPVSQLVDGNDSSVGSGMIY